MPLDIAFLKPVLTALVLPPAGPMLLVLCGWLAVVRQRSLRMGVALVLLGVAALWAVSCNGVAQWLGRSVLPQTSVIEPARIGDELARGKVQAIVVLGGGVESASREYEFAQPSRTTVTRMHYGLFLAHKSGLPLGFTGGQGWAASAQSVPEAVAVQRWLVQTGLPAVRWAEGSARDTRENAKFTAAMLQKEGITRIALVTHAAHMPRARRAFENAGLSVLPAPMGFTEPVSTGLLEWLPSAEGLQHSRQILHEWLGLLLGQ